MLGSRKDPYAKCRSNSAIEWPHCQTWSGSAFSLQTFLPEAALAVPGPIVVYELTTPEQRRR